MCMPVAKICLFSLLIIPIFLTQSAHAGVKDKIIFGGDDSAAPFEWEEGELEKGFIIDLTNKIAEVSGAHVVHKLGDWSEMDQALVEGDIDVLPMYISDDRKNRFLFSSPFYFVEHAIYTYTPKKELVSLDMLAHQNVAVEKSYFAHEELLKNHPEIKFILKNSTLSVLRAIEGGEAKYAILAIPAASYLIDKKNFNISAVSSPIWPRGYGFAVRKDKPELANWIEKNLNLVLTSESYHE